jgi:hypothetical protein
MASSEKSADVNVPAVQGENTAGGDDVFGTGRRGVVGVSDDFQGVFGKSRDNAGVVGESDKMHAVFGVTHSTFAGVFGASDAGGADVAGESNTGIGVHGKGGRLAGFFEGALSQSHQPYDKRVAGVVSGAGNYKPGIALDKRHSQSDRIPIALLGKVYCKADARYGSIEVGDLLTTSASPGHAMKASEPLKAFGAVIGKALGPLKEGQGLIPILIALQQEGNELGKVYVS